MKRLNYLFSEGGEITGVDVGFEDWTNSAIQYNITVKLHPEDADLSMSSPQQLAEVAVGKVQGLVTAE